MIYVGAIGLIRVWSSDWFSVPFVYGWIMAVFGYIFRLFPDELSMFFSGSGRTSFIFRVVLCVG